MLTDVQNRLCVHPKFLHSNATSHKWAFGGIAIVTEIFLIDAYLIAPKFADKKLYCLFYFLFQLWPNFLIMQLMR